MPAPSAGDQIRPQARPPSLSGWPLTGSAGRYRNAWKRPNARRADGSEVVSTQNIGRFGKSWKSSGEASSRRTGQPPPYRIIRADLFIASRIRKDPLDERCLGLIAVCRPLLHSAQVVFGILSQGPKSLLMIRY